MWALICQKLPNVKLSLRDVNRSLPSHCSDPSFSVAKRFAKGYGLGLRYERLLNNPKALFNRQDGDFLVQLQIETTAGSDLHLAFVAYLDETGHLIDDEPRSLGDGVITI